MQFKVYIVLFSVFCLWPVFAQADETGCLRTPDECKSTSWSAKIDGGNILSHISVSGNVLTLTLKTYKRDAELNKGMRAALANTLLCDAAKIYEFDPAHEFVYHPTYSGNHIHYPLFRNLFPFLPTKLNIWASIYAEKMLNRFQIDHKVVEAIVRNVEPEISDDNVRAIVNNFAEWEVARPAPQVLSSIVGAKVIELWLQKEAQGYGETLAKLGSAVMVVATVYSLAINLAQRRFATLA